MTYRERILAEDCAYAETLGRLARSNGTARESCPYTWGPEKPMRLAWFRGYGRAS